MGSYEDAITCLNSRRRKAAKASIDDMRGSDDMLKWLGLLGYSGEVVDGLSPIHIAGTKGKGSTCTFVASFLMAHGQRTRYPRKIGLYTSPHMKNIRERIRINGEPISKDLFTSRFFEIWKILPHQATPTLDIPRYLQLLALLSVHVFVKEEVDVAIFETHSGGEYDATNVIRTPLVTVVTSIGMDHVRLLGPTIEKIAWHKAGIFKPKCQAFSVPQEPKVTTEIEKRADEKGVVLKFVEEDQTLPINETALSAKPQRVNCSLALAVARYWLSQKVPEAQFNDEDIVCGIRGFSWPGRFQKITHGKCEWFLDCAHNELSLPYAAEWFAETVTKSQKYAIASGDTNYIIIKSSDITHPPRILIFSHLTERDGATLLKSIANALKDHQIPIHFLILTTYDIRLDGQAAIGICSYAKSRLHAYSFQDRNMRNRYAPEVHDLYADTWRVFDLTTKILRERTIEGALKRANEISTQNGIQALVTGSIHLVSGALNLLEQEPTVSVSL